MTHRYSCCKLAFHVIKTLEGICPPLSMESMGYETHMLFREASTALSWLLPDFLCCQKVAWPPLGFLFAPRMIAEPSVAKTKRGRSSWATAMVDFFSTVGCVHSGLCWTWGEDFTGDTIFPSPWGGAEHLGVNFMSQTLKGAGQAFGFRVHLGWGWGSWLLTLTPAPSRGQQREALVLSDGEQATAPLSLRAPV